MTATNPTVTATPVVISLGRAAWLIGATLFALAIFYVVGLEQGATSIFGGNSYVHEFMHDARHLLGFPCH
jgi:cobalt transporter subunit CbtB